MYSKKTDLKLKGSYQEMLLTSKFTVNFMKRDASEYAKYGVLESEISDFKQRVDEFEDRDFDEEYVGKMMIKTDAKNRKAEELKTIIRELILRAELNVGKNSPLFLQFKENYVSKMSDCELYRKAHVTINLFQNNADDLIKAGLTTDDVVRFEKITKSFGLALEEQQFVKAERNIAAQNRQRLAFELNEMMLKYRNLGRRMWIEKDEARSNDYVTFEAKTKTEDEEVAS